MGNKLYRWWHYSDGPQIIGAFFIYALLVVLVSIGLNYIFNHIKICSCIVIQ